MTDCPYQSELKRRQDSIFAEYPSGLKYHSNDLRDLSISGSTLYTKLVIYLEHLQNLFFIARLLVQRGHDSHADLMRVSFEMVSGTLIFWTHMDRLARGVHVDCEWLVCCPFSCSSTQNRARIPKADLLLVYQCMAYAAPAAGVLCNALLPTHQMIAIPGVNKSGMIQQLSLLVGFLDWVGPSAPNSDLCISCKAVIQHVLDLAINGPPPPVPSAAAGEEGDQAALDFNFDMDMGGFFNFDLLDTFDWMKPDSSQMTVAS